MASICMTGATPGQFRVYCGAGRYIAAISIGKTSGAVHIGDESEAVSLGRSEAVAACHAARRAGFGAWVVNARGAA